MASHPKINQGAGAYAARVVNPVTRSNFLPAITEPCRIGKLRQAKPGGCWRKRACAKQTARPLRRGAEAAAACRRSLSIGEGRDLLLR